MWPPIQQLLIIPIQVSVIPHSDVCTEANNVWTRKEQLGQVSATLQSIHAGEDLSRATRSNNISGLSRFWAFLKLCMQPIYIGKLCLIVVLPAWYHREKESQLSVTEINDFFKTQSFEFKMYLFSQNLQVVFMGYYKFYRCTIFCSCAIEPGEK